jgi:tetratricopeptide (TPR) repeat protein
MKRVVACVAVVVVVSAATPFTSVGPSAFAKSKLSAADQGQVHHAKGHELWEKEQREKALVEFRLALKYVSDWADVHTDVGDILAQMGDIKWNANKVDDAWALYKQADTAYKKAINSDPDYARSRLNYGVFLRDQAWSEPYRGAPASKIKALHEASLAQIRKAIELDSTDDNYLLQLAQTMEAAGYKTQARREFERVAQSKQRDIAKQAQAALAKYRTEDKKLEQLRLQNLRRASGTLLSEHVAKGKLGARDLYFVYQYKQGGPISLALVNSAPGEGASVKPTAEREKALRQLAMSFQALQKSTTPINGIATNSAATHGAAVNTIRPGDLLVNFATSQRYGTVAVVQSVDTSRSEMLINALMFDESRADAGITKTSLPLWRVKDEKLSYFLLRPVDTKFVSLLAQAAK